LDFFSLCERELPGLSPGRRFVRLVWDLAMDEADSGAEKKG